MKRGTKRGQDCIWSEATNECKGLYLNPPQHAAVFCVDEKPQMQAPDRSAPLLPLRGVVA